MSKRLILTLILLILLTTYNLEDKNNFNSEIKIKNIIVENNSILKEEDILKKLSFLYETNILAMNTNTIKKRLNEIDFIESFELKTIYPNTLKIKVFENEPIVILQNKKEKKFYAKNGKVISFIENEEFSNLPLVFGDQVNFKLFYENLKKVNFPINEIKTFYFFESNRWDLLTKKDQRIKLPIQNYNRSLKNFMELKVKANFEKFKIFDYRIQNQIILK